MPRRQLVLLSGILSVSILASVMTVVWGNEPLLGLDLQGGVSVRLAATEPATEEMLDQAVSIVEATADEGATLIADALLDETADLAFDALGGMDMGATPIAACYGMRAEQKGRPTTVFVVRKDGKKGIKVWTRKHHIHLVYVHTL